MSSLSRSAARKPSKPLARKAASPAPIAALSEAERKALKRRFQLAIGVTLACVALAFVGMIGTVNLRQWWGMPLFILAMVGGFGAQIVFILGLVKANRTDTRTNRGA
jgi:hypothetical protein